MKQNEKKQIINSPPKALPNFSRQLKNSQYGGGAFDLLGAIVFLCLLCAGIYFGYQKIMEKYRLKVSIEQINTIVKNMHTIYLAQVGEKQLTNIVSTTQTQSKSRPYAEFESSKGLSNGMRTAITLDVFPKEMYYKEEDSGETFIKNIYGGDVYIISEDEGETFSVIFEGLPQKAAVGLGSTDWAPDGLKDLQEVLLFDSEYMDE